jgi:hypothetical protein
MAVVSAIEVQLTIFGGQGRYPASDYDCAVEAGHSRERRQFLMTQGTVIWSIILGIISAGGA